MGVMPFFLKGNNMTNSTDKSKNTVQIFKSLALFSLDFNLWSAQKKLKPSDTKAKVDDLPPAGLASLGSWNYVNPKQITVFKTIKMRCQRVLEECAIKSKGGYLVPISSLDNVYEKLEVIKIEFDREVEKFVTNYDANHKEWKQQWTEWEQLLVSEIPSAAYVRSRFKMEFEDFKIQLGHNPDKQLTSVASLGNKLLDEVIESALLYKNTKIDFSKEGIAKSTKGTIIGWYDKIEGLAFLSDRNFKPLLKLLNDLIGRYETAQKGRLIDDDFCHFMATIEILSCPNACEFYISEPNYYNTVYQKLVDPTGTLAAQDDSGKKSIDSDLVVINDSDLDEEIDFEDFDNNQLIEKETIIIDKENNSKNIELTDQNNKDNVVEFAEKQIKTTEYQVVLDEVEDEFAFEWDFDGFETVY